MGQEVLSQINRTVRAFVTHDRDLAKEVIEEDAEVNEYEVKLEKKSFEIIALSTASFTRLAYSFNSSKRLFQTWNVWVTMLYLLLKQLFV